MSKRKKKTSLKQTNLKRKVLEGKLSIVELMQANAEGQDVYEIQDPSERLVSIVGTMMGEPKFYPTDPNVVRDENGCIKHYSYNKEDFDDQAQMIVNTAIEVAESESPSDLVKIAHWARKELKMRTTPQVLLAVAAQMEQTKPFVRLYAQRIINRADELKQSFIAYRSLWGSDHSLPNAFKRGLSDAFSTFRPLDFVKYEGQGRPTFADLLKVIDRKKGWPVSQALDVFLKTGEITDPKALPQLHARKQLAKCKSFGKQAKEYAKKSHANWEVLVSQFGNKAEVWEHLIETEALGYMALMRNLRNILQAGVSKSHLQQVCDKLVRGAVGSKQLPFRFLTAKMMIDAECSSYQGVKMVSISLEKAAEAVGESMHRIPGKTLAVVDSSGSMSAPVSGKSKMSCMGAGAMLCSLLYSNSSKGSAVGHFADRFALCRGVNQMGPLGIANHIIGRQGSVGYGTNMEDVLRWAIQNKKVFDRIVTFSDFQTYGGRYICGGDQTYDNLWKRYKKEIAPNCTLHSIDLAGHGRSVTKQGDTDVNLMNGFSEKMLDQILRFEGIDPESGTVDEEKREFTLEYIRKNY